VAETAPKKHPIWFIGTFFFVGGSLLNFVSFGFAAQSLLAALGSAQFISNVFFGKVVLGEDVTRFTLLATGIIILGNAIVVNFSSHTSVVYTADDLISFYDADFNGYAASMIAACIGARFIYGKLDERVKSGEVSQERGEGGAEGGRSGGKSEWIGLATS
jgi:drug/metabolite transporter (DMT)-like permease